LTSVHALADKTNRPGEPEGTKALPGSRRKERRRKSWKNSRANAVPTRACRGLGPRYLLQVSKRRGLARRPRHPDPGRSAAMLPGGNIPPSWTWQEGSGQWAVPKAPKARRLCRRVRSAVGGSVAPSSPRKKKAPGKAVSQGGEGHSLFRERLDAPAQRWRKGGQTSKRRDKRARCVRSEPPTSM
jgi:hypothetical protein